MRVANTKNKAERKAEILDLLRVHASISIQELSDVTHTSLSTVRRDLDEMAGEGLVRRKFGSVSIISTPGGETPFALRATRDQAEKKRIARAALDLVQNGSTIYLSGGTTTLELARLLPGQRRLTVITNALRVANVLVDQPGIDLMLLGGALRPDEQTLHGPLTEWGTQQFRAQSMFYGVEAISVRHGLTHSQVVEVNTDRAMARMVNQVIVLADHTKFERVAPVSVLPITDIHIVITGQELDRLIVEDLQASQVRVIQV
jgi:DeoR/GlpR family transcriptional regulator of sugar metabolism